MELILTFKKHFFLLGILILLFRASFALAQNANYQIGVGDLLHIVVLGESEFSGDFRVLSDGTIDYSFLRKISVQGKNTESLASLLTERLKDGYLVEPQISVEIREYQSQQVLVLGAVAKPGPYTLKEETRVLDLLSQAGGILKEGAKRIFLLRTGGSSVSKNFLPKDKLGSSVTAFADLQIDYNITPTTIDYYGLVNRGDLSQNLILQNGDILNVPKANEVFVLGSVSRPGPVQFEEKMTIIQAVTLAGGPTPIASPKSTYILRQGEEGEKKLPVRLDKILANKEKNVVVQPNDVIMIPESLF